MNDLTQAKCLEMLRSLFPDVKKNLMKRKKKSKLQEMSSHEFAKKLLALPDGPLCLVVEVDGPYVSDNCVKTDPWYANGQVRVMANTPANDAAIAGEI
jgi:hypothetical protein